MIHDGESAAARRRRFAVAGIAALLVHAALFVAAWRLSQREPPEPSHAAVELEIVGATRTASTPAKPAPNTTGTATSPSETSSLRLVARRAEAGAAMEPGEASVGLPDAVEVEPPDAGAGAAPAAGLDLALDWSGFERAFGERAEADREAYRESQRRRHVEAQGFGQSRGLVLRALGDNRRFAPLGEPLAGDEARGAIADYLAILDSRITPEFNAFLVAAGAPNDLLHAKARTGLLRYNPFYVPPPPGEFVDPGSVLRGVHKPALAQFALSARGDLAELRLVATSGSGAFDASALASIGAAAPFPPPPGALLSARARAHFEWGFDRNLRPNRIADARHLVVMALQEPREEMPDSGVEGPPRP